MSSIYLALSSSAENLLWLSTLFSEYVSYGYLIIIAFAALAVIIFSSAVLSSSFWINLCFFSMDDLLAWIFTFRGRLFRWFFVLLLLVFYSSTQGDKRNFPLFEDRILTDLEVEVSLVDFHPRYRPWLPIDYINLNLRIFTM